MKRFLLLGCLLLTSAGVFAQEKTEELESSTVSIYVATGASLGLNNDFEFKTNAYPSVEVGYNIKNYSLGAVFGRGDFNDYGKEVIGNYWYEAKASISANVEQFQPYLLFGVGAYFNSNHDFIEYGFGTVYKLDNINLYIQTSSWDNSWYLSPGISYSFN